MKKTEHQPIDPNAVSRMPGARRITCLGRSTIYARMDPRSAQYDPTFPRNFPLFGAHQKHGAKGWKTQELLAWVDAQAANALPR